MTLKRALRHENSKKVMDKLELIVPFISSASKIIFYFLNWYTTEYKQLFPLTLFPNFQLKCPLECHQSMMNLVCITLSTNINLCHLQYFDTEYLNNQVIKIIKSNIIEKTSDRKKQSKAIEAELTEEVLNEIKMEIKKKLKRN
eukprot:NODE_11_length_46995_cov_0.451872.p22 type:complete len:143 gc:universal NODE_11_length_46995_cov_0.451872:41561-41989(+)